MSLSIRKKSERIGVEVTGIDVAQGVAPDDAEQLQAALYKHFVVVIPNQNITPEQQVEFARIFGSPESLNDYGGSSVNAANTDLPAEIMKITNDPKDPTSKRQEGTVRWHTDLTWSKMPNKGAVLHAQKLPSEGAATRWCALYAAWKDLPEERKSELEKLRVVHSVAAAYQRDHPDTFDKDLEKWRKVPSVEHPLVWTHGDGNKSLVLGATADHIVGMSKSASEALFSELESWCTQEQYVCIHNWQAGDLLIWLNTATMHQAVKYTGSERRLLYRVTVAGEEEIS